MVRIRLTLIMIEISAARAAEGVGPYDGMHNLRIRLGAAMDLVGSARRDVGIAPYKVHSDSPEIGVHRGWGRTTVGADALGRPRGTEVIRLPIPGEFVFCPILA